MKKPIAIIWNDVHLKNGNEESILDAFNYMLVKAKELGITRTIFAGDLFDSRTMQRLKVLQTFDKMLENSSKAGITIDLISGNHDKTIYASYDSFLEQYRYHPGVNYYRGITELEYEGIKFTYAPFFSDDMLIPMLEESKGGDVLVSHFEMQGSTHLGKVVEKSVINEKFLSKWKKVYLGHYHNHHEITKDIVHLPAFIQASFGEDDNKGFSVLYDDLSYSIIKGRFRRFKKVSINLDTITPSGIKELLRTHENSPNSIRFEISGSESKVKAFDVSIFKDTNIDVKKKYEQKFDYEEDEKPSIIEKFDKASVQESFEKFCEQKGYDYKEGKVILDEFLKHK
jgi:exonuclease SbcD